MDLIAMQDELNILYRQIQAAEERVKIMKEALLEKAIDYEQHMVYSHLFSVVNKLKIDTAQAKHDLKAMGWLAEDYSTSYLKFNTKKAKKLLGDGAPMITSRYLRKKTERKYE